LPYELRFIYSSDLYLKFYNQDIKSIVNKTQKEYNKENNEPAPT